MFGGVDTFAGDPTRQEKFGDPEGSRTSGRHLDSPVPPGSWPKRLTPRLPQLVSQGLAYELPRADASRPGGFIQTRIQILVKEQVHALGHKRRGRLLFWHSLTPQ